MAKRAAGEGSSPLRGVSGVSGRSGSSSSSGTARAGATAVAKATRCSGVGAAVASGAGGSGVGRLGRGLAADAAAAVEGLVVKTPTTTPPRATSSGGSREDCHRADQGILIAAVSGALERRIERFWQGDVGKSPAAMLSKVALGMAARRGLMHSGRISGGVAKVPAGVVSVRGAEDVTAAPVVPPPPSFRQANGASVVAANDDCGSDVSVGWASTMTDDSDVDAAVVVVASDSEGGDYSSCYSGVTVDDDDEDDEDDVGECDEEEEAEFERAKALLHARLGASLAHAKKVERQVAALEVKNYELRTLLHVHAAAVAKQAHKTGTVHPPTAAL